ncbi:MAG: RNase adapter RapZ [Lachnospiraceae bacterium]|nr:RNase adapter RapZ [Eubacteriales bacterium]MDY2606599.1 RNase adapter RapZ [Lachnospiraceae bacterium]MDY6328139.1 RNase adapter RapZ [Lachnospiraceae bacterium]
MRFVIITGMSGAGKSSALKTLEDNNYFCVDNLPIELILKFAELTFSDKNSNDKNVALGIDIRSGQALSELDYILDKMKKSGYHYEILFLDANDDVLIKRFKETRRAHPLTPEGRVDEGIVNERKQLEFLRKQADYIIDTSTLLIRELRMEIEKIFVENKEYKNLFVTILSFGFKYGIPVDADLIFDVRFMPNPYYIDELKHKTGNDDEVKDFVMSSEVSQKFLDKLYDMIKFLIPNYVKEGKNQLVIGVGCTGGKHRSVTVANMLYDRLSEDKNLGIKVAHRDIMR